MLSIADAKKNLTCKDEQAPEEKSVLHTSYYFL